jgi:hypothetical protein
MSAKTESCRLFRLRPRVRDWNPGRECLFYPHRCDGRKQLFSRGNRCRQSGYNGGWNAHGDDQGKPGFSRHRRTDPLAFTYMG